MIVAIDGPAGAGKSSIARALAARLGFRYLDTGAMYRALTWRALDEGIPLDDGAALAALARAHPVTFGDRQTVWMDGVDVTRQIRSRRVDGAVSSVSRHRAVRSVMRERQRALAGESDVVIEGRDIGGVVVPQAELKVWLDAAPEERARRRHAQRPETSLQATFEELRRRDARDARNTHRTPDQVVLDTTGLSPDGVLERLEALVGERRRA